MKTRKTEPENLGLEGHLNLGFGFEKVWVTRPGFRVWSNLGCEVKWIFTGKKSDLFLPLLDCLLLLCAFTIFILFFMADKHAV